MALRFGSDEEFNRWNKSRGKPADAGKLKPRAMNKTEQAYAAQLEYEKSTRQILWWDFEAVTLRIGDDCRFTPDFLVMTADGELEFRDTKGTKKAGPTGYKAHVEEDAQIKMRAVAERYPFRFCTVWRLPEKEGGGWVRKFY